MALNIGTLVAMIRADNSGFRRGVDESEDDLQRFTRDANGRLRDMRGRFVREGHEAGRGFGRGVGEGDESMGRLSRIARRTLGVVRSSFSAAGESAVEMAQKVTGKESPQAALMTLGALMHALPIAAQLASIGITLGIGGGLAMLGVMVASKNAEVKESFADMASHVKARLTKISKPFEGELKKVAGIVKGTFDKFEPYLARSFQRIAPTVSQFVTGVASGVMRLGPVIEGISGQFSALMQVLSGRMPDLLGSLGGALGKISSAANPAAFNNFINVLVDLINTSAWAITKLSQLGGFLLQQYGVLRGIATLNFRSAKESLDGITTQIIDFGDAAGYAAKKDAEMNRKIAETASKALGARGSIRSLEEAIDNASESVKKNGKTLDVNTAKGRANQAALDAIASEALSMAQAMDASGQDSSSAMAKARAAFIRVARQMNMTKGEAAALATQLGLIPNKKSTRYAGVGVSGATKAARELGDAVRNIPNSKTTVLRVVIAGGVGAPGATKRVRQLTPQSYSASAYGMGASPMGMVINQLAAARLTPKERKSLQKSGQLILRGLLNGMGRSADVIEDKASDIAERIKKAFEKTAKRTRIDDNLLASLRRTTARLQDLAGKREKILAKIAEAKEFAADVTGGARQFAGLTSLEFKDKTGADIAPTGAGIRAGLASKLASIKQFAANIKKLAAKGLGKGLLRQLLEAGPEAGGPLAAALAAADSATFGSIQAVQREIDAVSNRLGRMGADLLYDSGKGAARGFLTGLIEQQKQIELQMAIVARNFAREIARALGLKDPGALNTGITRDPYATGQRAALNIENYHEAPRGSARGTAEQLLLLTAARG